MPKGGSSEVMLKCCFIFCICTTSNCNNGGNSACNVKTVVTNPHFSTCTFILSVRMVNMQIIFQDFLQNMENCCSCLVRFAIHKQRAFSVAWFTGELQE